MNPRDCQVAALLRTLGYPDPRTFGPVIAKCKADADGARRSGKLALAAFLFAAAAALEIASFGGDGGDPAQCLASVALDLFRALVVYDHDLTIATLA